jgi:hypothetical protein
LVLSAFHSTGNSLIRRAMGGVEMKYIYINV